jgi:hypothetical protein
MEQVSIHAFTSGTGECPLCCQAVGAEEAAGELRLGSIQMSGRSTHSTVLQRNNLSDTVTLPVILAILEADIRRIMV